MWGTSGAATAQGRGPPAAGSLPGAGAVLGLRAGLPGALGIPPGVAGALAMAGQAPSPDMQLMQALVMRAAQAAQNPAMAAQYTMQAAQAYDAQQHASTVIAPEITELAHHFKLDDRITQDLNQQLKMRNNTFDDDIKALYEILEGARHPGALLRVKIREMEEGLFRGTSTPDADVEELAKRYKLDAQASAKLAEVLAKRDDRKTDLKQITKHLELSNKPSALCMLMLKDLRAGKPVADPEYPVSVGSYAHKRGLRGKLHSKSPRRREPRREPRRDPRRERERTRRREDSSSSPPPRGRSRSRGRRAGSGTGDHVPQSGAPRAMTLLERF